MTTRISVDKDKWTPARVQILKRMWKKGETIANIARKLGPEFTKNSVTGKRIRLGLPDRQADAVRNKKVSAPTTNVLAYKPNGEPPEPPKPMRRLALVDLNNRVCKFPLGNPKTPSFAFCALDVPDGSTYCEFHRKLVYQPKPKKRDHLMRMGNPDNWGRKRA